MSRAFWKAGRVGTIGVRQWHVQPLKIMNAGGSLAPLSPGIGVGPSRVRARSLRSIRTARSASKSGLAAPRTETAPGKPARLPAHPSTGFVGDRARMPSPSGWHPSRDRSAAYKRSSRSVIESLFSVEDQADRVEATFMRVVAVRKRNSGGQAAGDLLCNWAAQTMRDENVGALRKLVRANDDGGHHNEVCDLTCIF
jgi:hypothetical protein